MSRTDPRTRLALGLMAISAVLFSASALTMAAELVLLWTAVLLLGSLRDWIRFLARMAPLVGLVFLIAAWSFDLVVASLLSLRLLNLLMVSFVCFHIVQPDELVAALRKMGVPYEFGFILSTAMRYVPLLGMKVRSIIDAQRSRGIDLRLRFRNLKNLLALLLPLLAQSFALAEDLAMAMESRGFGRKDRSFRRKYRVAPWEYALMTAALGSVVALVWWERG
jgi:energy-coupling factor transport system permease protein